jgi:hypothetical protein
VDPSDILEDISVSPEKRMQFLSQTATALGHAIAGAGRAGPAGISTIQILTEQLVQIVKRISWIEKTADPDWKPFDPTSAEGKAWLKNKKASTKEACNGQP